ncbi:hypothetical protein [Oleiharenicola lentus]|uniref:hypothetical protein n=1 Tax=Oleiharenicola lentus TaxID=2508720 RepID=UPI003F67732C
MSHFFKANYEKLLCAFAGLLVAGSGYFIWREQAATRRVRQQAVTAQLSGAAYTRADLKPLETVAANWPKAAPQSSGSGWLYEVFTPPVIYYNPLAKSFTVTPPRFGNEVGDLQFGLELLAVKLEPFRLQLVGYFGLTGDYLAAFVSPQQPETLLAREGKRFEKLGLTLKSFDVKKVVVAHHDAWPVYDIAGLAVLQDEKIGADIVLDSRERKLTDTPIAVLKLLTGDGKPREVREGDTFSDDVTMYRVERIQIEPAEVVIARLTPGLPVPETKVLHPTTSGDAHGAAKPATSQKFPAHTFTGLVTNRP